MQPTFAGIFDDAENRYLPTESLKDIHRYAKSVPLRLGLYRTLRDHEMKIMQVVADRLTTDFPAVDEIKVERALQNGMLVVRYCAMAMLMDNAQQLEPQLLDWLKESIAIHGTQKLDEALHHYLHQVLTKALKPQQMDLLEPLLNQAQAGLGLNSRSTAISA